MSKVEDNPHSRFVDYTCATDWETLINGIEAVLRGWKKHKSFHDIPNPQASVDYHGTKLALALFLRSPQHTSNATTPNSSGTGSSAAISGSQSGVVEFDDDPSHEQHEITRWFGQHNFLLLCPVGIHRMDDDGTFRAIFSALSVALGNMQFPLPCFMIMTKPERLHTTPLVLGYGAPVFPRRHTLQFQSVTVQGVHPRHEFYYLDGLFRHFELQLQSLIGDGTDADRAQFSATVVEFYKIARPYWASVREHAPSEDSEEEVATHQPLLDAFLHELWYCAPEVEYSGSVDTLQEMGVEIWYKGLKRGAVVDNEYYSTLLPSRVPPGGWRLRATFDDSIVPADSSYISSTLRTLLAVYIHAKASRSSTTIIDFTEQLDPERARYIATVVSHKTRDKVLAIVPLDDAEESSATTDVLVPHLFAESGNVSRASDEDSGFAMIHAAEMRGDTLSEKIRRELDNWYRYPAGDVDKANGPKGLSNWIPKSAPVARLLSMFAVYAASTENVAVMAEMWRELTQEVRLYCDRGAPLPRMRHDTAVDRATVSDHVNVPIWLYPFWEEQTSTGKPLELPDMNSSLLHQKLQMLQLCILGRELDPVVPPELVARYTNRQVHTAESTRLARRGSHQQLDDPDEDSFYDTVEQEGSESTRERPSDVPEAELRLLCTNEMIRVPALQRRAPLTEDLIEQNQQLLSRLTGEAADEALKIRTKLRMATIVSDMQAFKAENPNSVLADFVRWYYPACWIPDTSAAEQIVLASADTSIDSSNGSEGDDTERMVAQLESDAEGGDVEGEDEMEASSVCEAAVQALEPQEQAQDSAGDDPNGGDSEKLSEEESKQPGGDSSNNASDPEETKAQASADTAEPSNDTEQPESTRTVWRGHGSIDESLLMGQDTDWRRLWESAVPLPAPQQPKLFDIDQEAEKALNHIETLVPVRWAGELICAAMGSLHFMVQDLCTKYRHVVQIQEALRNLTDQMNEAIAAIREDMRSAGMTSNQQEEAVCQRTLVVCDAVCESIAHIERLCDRLGSLCSLLPNQWRLLGVLASDGAATATNEEEMEAISDYLRRCQLHTNSSNQAWSQSRELGPPSAKWFTLRCQARTTFIPVPSRDNQALLPPVSHRMFAATDASGLFRIALRFAELE